MHIVSSRPPPSLGRSHGAICELKTRFVEQVRLSPGMRPPLRRALCALVIARSCLSSQQHTEHAPDNWAVIVSTSRFWHNYRHAANALGIYLLPHLCWIRIFGSRLRAPDRSVAFE